MMDGWIDLYIIERDGTEESGEWGDGRRGRKERMRRVYLPTYLFFEFIFTIINDNGIIMAVQAVDKGLSYHHISKSQDNNTTVRSRLSSPIYLSTY